jgi:hypothetical protein
MKMVDRVATLNGTTARLIFDSGSRGSSAGLMKDCIGKMVTDVYCLCPKCNGVTDGAACGDPDDFIICNKCNHKFPARKIGDLKLCTTKNVKEKPLYVEEGKANMLIG